MESSYLAKCGAERMYAALDDRRLEEFESILSAKLPREYREFLLEWNGVHFRLGERTTSAVCPTQPANDHSECTPSWDAWNPSRRRSIFDSISQIEALFGLPESKLIDDYTSLWQSNLLHGFRERVPARFLVIGQGIYSITLVCMSLAGPDRGHIYDWATPIEPPQPDEDRNDLGSMGWIAPNFREFWHSVRSMSTKERSDWGC
jgi:hypothetical protein